MSLAIECQVRPADSKPNALRQSGLTPAVLYGHNGNESLPLMIKTKLAEFLVRDARGQKAVVDVTIPEISWAGQAVLQEIQAHPAKNTLYHLSFWVQA
ncbi:50S ribosomal protein L25 [Synechococcus sp. PCC 6312]|uniref:50S ribosomal protein L25 n=1 Tax=Synechococcus sp. (strain ATCC 27167 / PCC 6312) TaxID=195253 RepID=UPI00029EF568|nr:50S ribosomal protein L25 [Synechococcus sp. PCC 6312]AFY61282.1 ribosomal protein L25 (general stress protein Ctc) [Synechococcus sp. PCC 6312]